MPGPSLPKDMRLPIASNIIVMARPQPASGTTVPDTCIFAQVIIPLVISVVA
jgi:hypothetical protein